MQPHRWDGASLNWMIDPRLNAWLTAILSREPYAVQTMFYFKPPGARGQALHQDQFYLRVDPGACVPAWLAIDRCDESNGCLASYLGRMRCRSCARSMPILALVSPPIRWSCRPATTRFR